MFHVDTCPHCLKHDVAMRVVQVVMAEAFRPNLYLCCPNCKLPSCARGYSSTNLSAHDMLSRDSNTQDLKVTIEQLWPQIPAPLIPDHLPEAATRSLLQAETNFRQPKHEEAAAVMYRKALEVGLKTIDPELKGTLAQRIKSLADAGQLTRELADWAREIKNLGNDGAHELDAIDRDELTQMRGLVGMVLQYLFTLPEQVSVLRSKVKETT
jgi:hypothetical protein